MFAIPLRVLIRVREVDSPFTSSGVNLKRLCKHWLVYSQVKVMPLKGVKPQGLNSTAQRQFVTSTCPLKMEGFFPQAGKGRPLIKAIMREERMSWGNFPVLFPLPHTQPNGNVIMAAHCQGAWVAFRAEFVPQDAESAACWRLLTFFNLLFMNLHVAWIWSQCFHTLKSASSLSIYW